MVRPIRIPVLSIFAAALPLNGAGKIDRGAAQAMLTAQPH
jgi:hypothetical protein